MTHQAFIETIRAETVEDLLSSGNHVDILASYTPQGFLLVACNGASVRAIRKRHDDKPRIFRTLDVVAKYVAKNLGGARFNVSLDGWLPTAELTGGDSGVMQRELRLN